MSFDERMRYVLRMSGLHLLKHKEGFEGVQICL